MNASRALFRSGARRWDAAALSLSRVCFSTTVSGGQAVRVSSASPRDHGGRLPRILRQRWLYDWRSLEHQPLRRADHAVDDGAFEQLAGSADDHPSEASEPAPLVHRREESLGVAAVLDHNVAVASARSLERLAGVGAPKPGAGRRADQMAG